MNKDMEQKELDLCEILKNHIGETFYSPAYGYVEIVEITKDLVPKNRHIIVIPTSRAMGNQTIRYDGTIIKDGELMLFPSKTQKDWYAWLNVENNVKTYEDVAQILFLISKRSFRMAYDGTIRHFEVNETNFLDVSNGTSENQLKKLIALNKLMNVQKWIEKGWKPDWINMHQIKWVIRHHTIHDTLDIMEGDDTKKGLDIYFSSKSNAEKAIKILGEDVIRQALSTYW